MSDIDFEELDRAVNGALNGGPAPVAPPQPSAPAQVSTPVIDNVVPPVETPAFAPAERTTLSNSTAISSPAPVSATPAARRSSGRFMDMVHPSSDMRSQATGMPVETPRVAPAPRVSEVPELTMPAQPMPVSTPEYSEAPAWNEPLESPFLPDAKVEKRPLGGGESSVASENSTVTDSFDFQGLLDEPEEELLEAPEPQERLEATTLPDPIDFAATSEPIKETQSDSLQTIESTLVEPSQLQPEEVTERPRAFEQTAPQPAVEEPVGPTSITPQYKEQPSTNQESGAIFDTESYHQPVVAPAKKKSGWLTVLLILLLLVLGAGAGWAIYTYVLPML
jgi:hypothetical protein